MPVYTAEGLAAKQRVIERAEFSPDVMEIISEVLRQDFQRATG